MSVALSVHEQVPDGLLDCPADGLEALLGGPTLLHLPGAEGDALYLSVLLHGNETTGWDALRGILRDFENTTLPRPMSVFIGNVRAAAAGVRHLDDQPDYNRLWDFAGDTPEHRLAREVFAEIKQRRVRECIDVHNTTGPNPHYSCVNYLNPHSLYLARRFSELAVHAQLPASMQSLKLNELCPAITIECGLPESPEGVIHARAYLEQRLFERTLPDRMPNLDTLQLFHTLAQVRIPSGVAAGFGDAPCDLRLVDGIEQHNFTALPAGFVLGHWCGDVQRLGVRDAQGADVFDTYFVNDGDALTARVEVIPSMLTDQTKIIAQDCLCYLMEPLPVADIA